MGLQYNNLRSRVDNSLFLARNDLYEAIFCLTNTGFQSSITYIKKHFECTVVIHLRNCLDKHNMVITNPFTEEIYKESYLFMHTDLLTHTHTHDLLGTLLLVAGLCFYKIQYLVLFVEVDGCAKLTSNILPVRSLTHIRKTLFISFMNLCQVLISEMNLPRYTHTMYFKNK